MIISNLRIHTMDNDSRIIENGYIRIENGLITEIGYSSDLGVTDDNIIDLHGLNAYPGFIDAHTHLGVFGDSEEFCDGNEDSDPITPQLRVIDGIDTGNLYFEQAVRSGITTVIISPGSTNPVAGQISAVKCCPSAFPGQGRIDDMIIRSPIAVKFALGENPKSTYNDKEQMPVTRMAVAAVIRETLEKAKRYEKMKAQYESDMENCDEPEYDQKSEALVDVIRREIPVHFHAHSANDIFTALRISKEFNIRAVIVHATQGHEICEVLRNETEGVLSGPILTDVSKPELRHLSISSPAILSQNNVPVALITDHPETPVCFLPLCAAVAVRGGMDREEALKAITIRPAQICGIADRVGSIETGKDADMVFFRGDPLDVTEKPLYTMINGRLIEH